MSWKKLRKKLTRKSKPLDVKLRAANTLLKMFTKPFIDAQRRIDLDELKIAEAEERIIMAKNRVVMQDIEIEIKKLKQRQLEQKLGITREPFAPDSDTPPIP